MKPVRSEFKNDSYKLYDDYNDIHLFVEDKGFEKLYEVILRNFNLSSHRVFSCCGKDELIEKARRTNDKQCVFLIDADWDYLTGRYCNLPKNVLRLRRHSIENYLLDYAAFRDLIVDEKPKCKELTRSQFDAVLDSVSEKLKPLFCCFVAEQCSTNPSANCSIKPARFARGSTSQQPDTKLIEDFINNSGILPTKEVIEFFQSSSMVEYGHGKYMLHFVWRGVGYLFNCKGIDDDSLKVRLARLTHSKELEEVVQEIVALGTSKA